MYHPPPTPPGPQWSQEWLQINYPSELTIFLPARLPASQPAIN